MNCLPRGKLPALRWTLPRALCWVSGIASPLVRMSLRAMILLQAPVGLRENAVAIFRELLADDDVERELLELADPGDPTLAEGQQPGGRQEGRSKEHTSELQSLMRISYAVFCLKKKTMNE